MQGNKYYVCRQCGQPLHDLQWMTCGASLFMNPDDDGATIFFRGTVGGVCHSCRVGWFLYPSLYDEEISLPATSLCEDALRKLIELREGNKDEE